MIPTMGTMVLGGLERWKTQVAGTNNNQDAEGDDDLTFNQRKRKRKLMESEAETMSTVHAMPKSQDNTPREPKTSKE